MAKSDSDLQAYCNRFSEGERCARTSSKECLSGIHRTAVGAVASATKRWRTRECRSAESRLRYIEPVKCINKKAAEMTLLFQNQTALMQGIRDLPISPEEKVLKMCCAFIELDRSLERSLNRDCPKSTALVLGIVHGMTEDARGTLCVNPKCSNALNKVINTKFQPGQNYLEPVTQILFQLSVN